MCVCGHSVLQSWLFRVNERCTALVEMFSIFYLIGPFVRKRDRKGREETGSGGKIPLASSFILNFAFMFLVPSESESKLAGGKKIIKNKNHRITKLDPALQVWPHHH